MGEVNQVYLGRSDFYSPHKIRSRGGQVIHDKNITEWKESSIIMIKKE
jgi:hypothetical protein